MRTYPPRSATRSFSPTAPDPIRRRLRAVALSGIAWTLLYLYGLGPMLRDPAGEG